MKAALSEEDDLSLVAASLEARGLTAVCFSKKEIRSGKTPDFRIMDGAKLFAYCEVKSPREEWLECQRDRGDPWEIVGGVRNDPMFNRISKLVQKAAKQFDAVNLDRAVPNILTIVNHDDASDVEDLIETLSGMFHSESGRRYFTMKHVSKGRVKDAKVRIDLCIWIDGKDGRVQGYVFSESVPGHVDALCAKLGVDQTKILR